MNNKPWEEQGPKAASNGGEIQLSGDLPMNEKNSTIERHSPHGSIENQTSNANVDLTIGKGGEKPSDISSPASAANSLLLEVEDSHIYPEGGLRAWLVVFGSFCGMFASLGIANSLASFQAYISENQLVAKSPDQIGWIFSIYTFLSFACGIYIGPLFDVYGPRWLLLPGSVCVVASMMLIGICTGK